ncbi:MAG: ATP-binding protein [Candidatus Promineifilaceae bacterium]|nr:ATP-binding protein [Candidatus Promineifilaceae bacterium]
MSQQLAPMTLPGVTASIRAIGEYVLAAGKKAAIEKTAAYRLRLAVEEIATNAVVHGYQRTNQEGELLISACIDPCCLRIVIEDTGPAYDPRQTPLPTDLDQPLDERPEGGLGVYLALIGVDDYDYQHLDGTNRHQFIQYRER